jgi:hypothetical protein
VEIKQQKQARLMVLYIGGQEEAGAGKTFKRGY